MSINESVDYVLIPAGYGGTIEVNVGQYICVLDVEGGQCADFWAVQVDDHDHVLSPPHFFIDALRVQPKIGDRILSNRRLPMVTMIHDDVGWHDMLAPSCDNWRYEYTFGIKGHRNCCDNFREAMSDRGIDWGARPIPHPFNIFMNSSVESDGTIVIRTPTSNSGDRLIMRAEMDIIAVVSACPMDLTETGARGITDIKLYVSDSLEALKGIKR